MKKENSNTNVILGDHMAIGDKMQMRRKQQGWSHRQLDS